ncbi:hypothetical protein X474_03560 [Dethiosulfatarculus sandiegensis]|uniref:PpiC domain-containing protein n=2 Tax=Dethiosulfatarculus sandiegensis TaxID=1429043 RepID=A0A0D2JI76_9BACT|nr:hypothetical protein X474_03560 [Dethiosulfatarculus sandiegensis]
MHRFHAGQRVKSLVFVLLIGLSLGMAACNEAVRPAVVAKVNSRPLLLDQFKQQAAFMGLGNEPSRLTRQLREAVLEALVIRELILDEARSKKFTLNEVDLEKELTRLKGSLDQAVFQDSLASQGLSYDAWREVVADELLAKRTMDLVLTPKVQVGADEIGRYYETHKPEFTQNRQVLIRHAVFPSLDKAKLFLQKIEKGGNMAVLVNDLGGNLPEGLKPTWLEEGRMPEAMDKKVFALKAGRWAGPLTSAYGFHVIEVKEKQPARVLSLAQAAAVIQRKISAAKKQDLAAKWLADLRAKAQVWFDPGFIAKGSTGVSKG